MRCEDVQMALSAAMDGAEDVSPAVDAHLRACPRCSSFRAGAWRLRELARFQPADRVPDLTPAIMSSVRDGASASTAAFARRSLRDPSLPRRSSRWTARAAVAALLAGFLAGASILSGGLVPGGRSSRSALAQEIPGRLLRAAATLDGYQAQFHVVERNWSRRVARRTFLADVAFRAPESLRVQVRDTTRYPAGSWPKNDLLLVTNGKAWQASGPGPCPDVSRAVCGSPARVTRTVRNRPPFSMQTPMPTDIIVPMTVLAAANRVEVLGPTSVAGRRAVAVELPYLDATPLFEYLRFLGSWRPFFSADRVVVSLDERTWFPLRYEVYPAPGRLRAAWAARNRLPVEPPGRPVFTAQATGLAPSAPPTRRFSPSRGGTALDQGFRDGAIPRGWTPPAFRPRSIVGLPLWRSGSFRRAPGRHHGEAILAYAKGLSWMTLTFVRKWREPRPFGVGAFAERVQLGAGRGVGYYEPATSSEPRRLAIHSRDGELLLSSNLPRASLVEAARSLRLTGNPAPTAWRIRRWSGGTVRSGLKPEEAIGRVDFPVLLPAALPSGYRAVAGETFESRATEGLTVVFRRPWAELDGVGLRLYQARGAPLPPPTEAAVHAVFVRGVRGRWSPGQHLLEWIEQGVYRSLSGPSFELAALLRVADSLRPSRPDPTG